MVVEGNGDTNDKSIWERQIRARIADATVSAGRVKGRAIKWASKSKGRGQLSIRWELGIRDDGYVPGQVTYAISDLCKVSTFKGKFLSDPKFAFTLEAYTNGTPAPNILPKESNRVLQSIIDS